MIWLMCIGSFGAGAVVTLLALVFMVGAMDEDELFCTCDKCGAYKS